MHSRVLDDGQVLTFAASGWTWMGLFVLQDLETGSLWWTGLGGAENRYMLCIAGPHQDKQLPPLVFFRGYWSSWYGAFPQSLYLKAK